MGEGIGMWRGGIGMWGRDRYVEGRDRYVREVGSLKVVGDI